MLLRNGRLHFGSVVGLTTGAQTNQNGNIVKGGFRNRFAGGLSQTFGAYPSGQLAPSAFVLPQKAGAISSYREGTITVTGSGSGAAGINMEATATITLSVTQAQLDQIVSLVANGTITFTGSATASGAANASATGTITISAPPATLGGIFSATASGNIQLSANAVMTALGFMEVDLTPATLTADAVAQKILDESDIETGYSMREALRLILSALAGKVSGGGTTTITIRNVTDNKNRITATVDSNGNRTAVTYNVSD